MPKGSSGSISAFIKGLLAHGGKSGASNPLDVTKLGNLEETERLFRDRPVENIAVFNDISKQPIAAATGDKHSVGVPNVSLKGTTLTHNHPDARWGGTMSYADLHVLLQNDVRSMRAVGRRGEGGYVFRQGSNPNASGLYNRVYQDRSSLDSRMRAAADAARTAGRSAKEVRQAAVGVLHNYYAATAQQYGYVYRRRRQIGS